MILNRQEYVCEEESSCLLVKCDGDRVAFHVVDDIEHWTCGIATLSHDQVSDLHCWLGEWLSQHRDKRAMPSSPGTPAR